MMIMIMIIRRIRRIRRIIIRKILMNFFALADPTGPGPCTRILTGLSALLVRFLSAQDIH